MLGQDKPTPHLEIWLHLATDRHGVQTGLSRTLASDFIQILQQFYQPQFREAVGATRRNKTDAIQF
jgi:hypothetical protein